MKDDSITRPALCFEEIVALRISRRNLLTRGSMLGLFTLASGNLLARGALSAPQPATPLLTFGEIEKHYRTTHALAEGYDLQLLIRWGDPVLENAPAFNPRAQSASSQARQFGYNADYIAYLPYPSGSNQSDHGLLFVNHEYSVARLMFSGFTEANELDMASPETILVEQQAHGFSIIEVKKLGERWQTIIGSPYNRRATASTPMEIRGPAAGSPRLCTEQDTTGTRVLGTLGNCAGGTTPWGTVLTAEENIDGFFIGKTFPESEARNHKRMGIGKRPYYAWGKYESRFDAEKTPHEPNRFGWIVEIDPFAPDSPPVKRTALGRFKHECATTVTAPDGRLVLYSGDDQMYEFLYRFVSRDKVNRKNPSANKHLLDDGTLYAARFNDDGTVQWLPLLYGTAPLTSEHGFHSQADVLIEARSAASLMGATPMDRPEDIAIEPSGKQRVYVALTNNKRRTQDEVDAANPRAKNLHGHILELTPPDNDHTGALFHWDIFLKAGNPASPEDDAFYATAPSVHGWLSCPDNLTFDPQGNLWISTDGQPEKLGLPDGLYATHTSGAERGKTRLFFNAPKGAEVTGPCFTPDGSTLFLSVQHPGKEDENSHYDAPSTRWPDFDPTLPPRPSVVAIVKKGGGVIGS